MRDPFWWQWALAIVVVLAAIGVRSSISQDSSTPQPRQTLNIDVDPSLPTMYKELLVSEFKKWYPIAEGKTRGAIVGNIRVNKKHGWASLLEWTTDVAKWETHVTTEYKSINQFYDVSVGGALKIVQDLAMSSGSARPKVVLFLTTIVFDRSNEKYKIAEAKELADKLKADGVLPLMGLQEVFLQGFGRKIGGVFDEIFEGSEFIYDMSIGYTRREPTVLGEKFEGLPAWIESRVTSTFCNETKRGGACFYNDQHECKHGKYHPQVPLTAGDCEVLGYKLPELTGTCTNETCEETCDRLWPLDVPCSASTCDGKEPKRQGPMTWNQLAYCPAIKVCEECAVTTVPTTLPVTTNTTPADVPVTTTTKPDNGGAIVDGSAVQLIITVVTS